MITGSSLDVGKAAAAMVAREGAQVVLNDIDEECSDCREVEVMVAQAIERFGRIDILINTAENHLDTSRFLEEISLEEWRRVVDRCLTTQFLCCQRVVPHMKAHKYGRIVNVSAMAGASGESPHCSPSYSAARAGMLALTRQLALELGPAGITVNAIVEDDLICDSAIRSSVVAEDIASIIVFLASDDASYITGETIPCKAGRLRADQQRGPVTGDR